MALNFQDVTLDAITVSVVSVGEDQWIQESALADIDKKFLEAALEEATLDDYDIPQVNMTAAEYFAPFIKTAAQLSEGFAYNRVRAFPTRSIVELEATVAALEARVEELETPTEPESP